MADRAKAYTFPLLYDLDSQVSRAYEVYNRAGYANPAVFVVDANGSIVWEHRGSAYHRTPLGDIIAQLEKLS